MSRETVGKETRSGDLTVEGTVAADALGVGTDSPTGTVDIAQVSGVTTAANGVADHLVLRGYADSGMSILGTNTSEGNIFFGDTDSVTAGRIQYLHSSDAMRVYTAGSERMRIDSSGNVGIGTSNPGNTLHVQTSSNTPVRFSSSTRYTSVFIVDDTGSVFVQNDGGDLRLLIGADAAGAGASERMRINSAGLITGSGTSLGAWTAYTPTLGGTGWALGNGTATGRYCQIGKIVFFSASIVFGSTSTYGASDGPTISYPIARVGGFSGSQHQHIVSLVDSSLGNNYNGSVKINDNSSFEIVSLGVNSLRADIDATSPFLWASTDVISVHGTYQAG